MKLLSQKTRDSGNECHDRILQLRIWYLVYYYGKRCSNLRDALGEVGEEGAASEDAHDVDKGEFGRSGLRY